MAGDHLSAYQLTIEPGTAFWRDGVPALDEAAAADLYDATQAILDDRGLPLYEISNHARPGGECRHNLAVWRGGGEHVRAGVFPRVLWIVPSDRRADDLRDLCASTPELPAAMMTVAHRDHAVTTLAELPQ